MLAHEGLLDAYPVVPIVPEMYDGLCEELGQDSLDMIHGVRIYRSEE